MAVENAYGWLKGQFPCLRALSGRKIRDMDHFIESLLIVHNIIEEFGDDPKDISEFNGLEDPWVDEVFHGAPERLDDDDLYRAGYIDENSCLSTVGPFNNLVYEFCVLEHLVYNLFHVCE